MARVHPKDWTPVGVSSLEAAAERVVRSTDHCVVIAGPGAGKTELLAQRACFLLQTHGCRSPRRILAISFKRDAARNLGDRVLLRCGRPLGARFDSLTFDAFAKSLLDRFRLGLPPHWRPTADYQIASRGINEKRIGDWLEPAGMPMRERAAVQRVRMYNNEFIGTPLEGEPRAAESREEQAASLLWEYFLHHGSHSTLNFQMIGRLAELVLRENPRILKALQATYSHVFLDEFQDTTGIQYDLTTTAFLDSHSVLTAVGDNKQRIMGWAGALDDVFSEFKNDFDAMRVPLVRNYRAAPELVRILGHLAAAIDADAPPPEPQRDGTHGDGECRVLLFEDYQQEAETLAAMTKGWIEDDGLAPRDICILTRNRPGEYTERLRDALEQEGIEGRVESDLQDLLAEPVTTVLLDMLNLVARQQAPEARAAILDLLFDFEGGEEQESARRVERGLRAHVKHLREVLGTASRDEAGVRCVIDVILAFLQRDRITSRFPQYEQGTYLDDLIDKLCASLGEYSAGRNWDEVLDILEGKDSVPIMTTHKSKGLEYHTIVFVGLEDSALWGFQNGEDEETRGFFVAFSRAKYRVIFTFSKRRPRPGRTQAEAQSRRTINRLYELLRSAGVALETIE